MNDFDIMALFGIMLALAAVPSTSVVVVVARAATFGFSNGAVAAAGIAVGDLIYVLIALSGLSVIAGALGELFLYVKHLGGLYLIWFGISIWRSGADFSTVQGSSASYGRSFLTGLLITLGDLKAVFFYASLFPAFVEVGQLQLRETVCIVLMTVVTAAAVKLVYAALAHKVVQVLSAKQQPVAQKATGGLVLGAGVVVIAKA